MMKSIYALAVLTIATAASAAEPFTLFERHDESVPKQPQAFVSSSGVVHVTFGVDDQVYYCSIDHDKLSPPQVAFQVPNMSLGMRRGPRIAHTGTAITISAIGGAQGKGRDGDILSYRSMDGGKIWLGPVKVNDMAASAREGLHAMTCSEDGTLWCVWLDLREKGTRLFAAKSLDHGATWSQNVLVYRSPAGSICECCHPSILATKDAVHVLFRNSLQGNRDMYLVSSYDQGVTFGEATRLGRNPWQLNACPMDGGMLAINKSGQLVTVWRRERSVFRANAKSGSENLLGLGDQPWVACDGAEFFTVWTSQRDGELRLEAPGSSESQKLCDGASYPVVVASAQPNPSVYVLFEKRGGQIQAIRVQ